MIIVTMPCPIHPHTASGHWPNGAIACELCDVWREACVTRDMANEDKAFENTQTSVAASQMRNALNNLSDTVKDPADKKVSSTIDLGSFTY